MSENPSNIDRRISCIEGWIEELKQQRHRFELLIIVKFRSSQQVLDQWTMQYLELSEMKRERGLKLILLPPRERELLKQVLGSKQLQEYDNLIDKSISQLVSEGRTLTIADMGKMLKAIDALIVDLIVFVRKAQQGDRAAILKAKDVILKRIAPICGGIALIALDINPIDWRTIVGGGALISKGLE